MARRGRVGTLAWTRQTRGIMNGPDRIAFVVQACMYGLATLPAEVRRALGIRRRRLAQIDPSSLAPPDTSVARAAEELVARLAPPMVVNHAYRTFAWGSVLAAHDAMSFDREVVYVASLLHDLYFADPHAAPRPHCFTLPAVDQTIALAADHGWDTPRRDIAAEAITLHLNVTPPRSSAEAYVVYTGARLDVVGYRYDELHPETIRTVLERHPRLDLKRDSKPMFDAQSTANRGSRADFLHRCLAVSWFIRHAPFDE
jgi:hypothetical protein